VIKPFWINGLSPFVGLAIAAGTGNSMNILKLFNSVSRDCPATFFVVQHGPKWMTDLLVEQIRLEKGFPCHITSQGLQP
jgi:chemotaxis response regulator CheB